MNEELEISFGAHDSPQDHLRVTSDMISSPVGLKYQYELTLPENVKDLCNQRKLGICTMCCVRKMAEQHFNDGVRLSEYWGYLIGKVLIEGGLNYEGSAILYMLKGAKKYGIPSKEMEDKYPLKKDGTYQEFVDDFNEIYKGEIPKEVLENAKTHPIPGYYQVTISPTSLATEIQKGKMLGYRFSVGENTYTDKKGKYSNLAKDLLPLRAYKHFEGGHAWPGYKHTGLTNESKFAGLQSWSSKWCPDNKEDGAGHYNFIFGVQAPLYFTEAWAVMDDETRFIFKNDLKLGDSNAEVANLQKVLVKGGYLVMPSGISYGYFGPLTKYALQKYQLAKGIIPQSGFCGPITRAELNLG